MGSAGVIAVRDERIGERLFTDGMIRSVYRDATGQYVIGDGGAKVYGVWLVPSEDDLLDVPLIRHDATNASPLR